MLVIIFKCSFKLVLIKLGKDSFVTQVHEDSTGYCLSNATTMWEVSAIAVLQPLKAFFSFTANSHNTLTCIGQAPSVGQSYKSMQLSVLR